MAANGRRGRGSAVSVRGQGASWDSCVQEFHALDLRGKLWSHRVRDFCMNGSIHLWTQAFPVLLVK